MYILVGGGGQIAPSHGPKKKSQHPHKHKLHKLRRLQDPSPHHFAPTPDLRGQPQDTPLPQSFNFCLVMCNSLFSNWVIIISEILLIMAMYIMTSINQA